MKREKGKERERSRRECIRFQSGLLALLLGVWAHFAARRWEKMFIKTRKTE